MDRIWQTIFRSDVHEITHYQIENLALMFFIFAFIGFVWEVIYISITEKVVAKRGMLHGPWVPLYGIGGVAMLIVLSPFRSNPPLVFFLAMLLCGTVEYFTGVAIEHFYGQRWWDYSTKRLHFKGRICLSGIMLFGVSGTAAVCGFGPPLQNMISHLPFKIHVAIVAILGLAFIIDIIVSLRIPNSGKGVTYELLDFGIKESDSDDNHAEAKCEQENHS